MEKGWCKMNLLLCGYGQPLIKRHQYPVCRRLQGPVRCVFMALSCYKMIPGSKGQKAVHACMIRLLNLGPAKHEKVAIYVVNQRISNVCRIAAAASQRSNS